MARMSRPTTSNKIVTCACIYMYMQTVHGTGGHVDVLLCFQLHT